MNEKTTRILGYIAIGTIGATAVAGSTYFLVDSIEKDDKPEQVSIHAGQAEIIQIEELANLHVAEYESGEEALPYLLTATPLNVDGSPKNIPSAGELLEQKIIDRLGTGPEVAVLKAIYIQKEEEVTEGANGVYIVGTNEIFINSDAIIDLLVQMEYVVPFDEFGDRILEGEYIGSGGRKAADFKFVGDDVTEVIAETIFQVIYHEYGHHMAHVYLNSDYRGDSIQPTLLAERNEDGSTSDEDTEWNTAFLNTFKTTLGYNDTTTTDYQNASNTWYPYQQNPDDPSDDIYDGQKVVPITDVFSMNELWNLANDTSVDQVSLGNGELVDFFGPTTQALSSRSFTDLSEVLYTYSANELFTRKMMQATFMLPQTNPYDPDGFVKSPDPNGPYRYVTTFLGDTLKYASGINPFYEPYALDAPYTRWQSGVDASNAIALYNAMTTTMGYNTSDDISVMWWENDGEVLEDGNGTIPTKTDRLRFGGYVADNTYQYIGYYDSNNVFRSTKISVSEFGYKVKAELDSTSFIPADPSKDAYYYTIDSYVDVDDIKDKPLFFSTDGSGTNTLPMTSTNTLASTDVRAWEADDFMAHTASTKIENGSVMIKLENL